MTVALAAFVLAALVLSAGCTEVSLYSSLSEPNLPNRIGVGGQLCTDDPTSVAFPVKVLVVVDGTAEVMPPATPTGSAAGVRALLSRYQLNPNYKFGVVIYDGLATSPTSGFARDTATINQALNDIELHPLSTGSVLRSYIDAIRAAAAAVQDDVLSSPPGLRSRTRYEIVWLSYGPPTPDLRTWLCQARNINITTQPQRCTQEFLANFCPTVNAQSPPAGFDCEADAYARAASELRQFVIDQGAQDLHFHTMAMGTDARMATLLNGMATAGHGVYASQTPPTVNLLAFDLTQTTTVLNRRDVVVFNPNAAIEDGVVLPDSDADGLSDELELSLGTDPTMYDTDGDYVGDGTEVRLKAPGLVFDPLVPAVFDACSLILPIARDTDEDGLNDCEEALLRTDASLVDTDRDGIPDLVEVRRGGNPLADDTLFVTAKDGIPDGEKMKRGLVVTQYAAGYELEIGYRYRIFDEGQEKVLGINPADPVPGVHIVSVATSSNQISSMRYEPGPPAMLSWRDNVLGSVYGSAVDVSAGGTFEILGNNGQVVIVEVDESLLPLPVLGPMEENVVVSPSARNCFAWDVRNISLVETEEIVGGRPGRGWQNLQVYMGELPASTPQGYPIFNRAVVPMRFVAPDRKTPNKSFLEMTQDEFSLIAGSL